MVIQATLSLRHPVRYSKCRNYNIHFATVKWDKQTVLLSSQPFGNLHYDANFSKNVICDLKLLGQLVDILHIL